MPTCPRRPAYVHAAEERLARQCELVHRLNARGHAVCAAQARDTLVLLEHSLPTLRHSAALLAQTRALQS
jgi:hypothetical protein